MQQHIARSERITLRERLHRLPSIFRNDDAAHRRIMHCISDHLQCRPSKEQLPSLLTANFCHKHRTARYDSLEAQVHARLLVFKSHTLERARESALVHQRGSLIILGFEENEHGVTGKLKGIEREA